MWPFLLKLTMVSAIAAHGADLASTENCLGAGRCRELNPWLARFEQPAIFGAAKMGVAAGSLWGTAKFAESHPKLAVLANVAVSVTFSGIAIHNARVSGGPK